MIISKGYYYNVIVYDNYVFKPINVITYLKLKRGAR